MKRTVRERFEANFQKGDKGSCWNWKGYRKSGGYGAIFANGKNCIASRVCWELTFGSIPSGMDVLHKCDNPLCVNPSHLFLGTASDNLLDAYRKGRFIAPAGERNGRAKLTTKQVRYIRESSLHNACLGRLLGVSKSLIGLIRKGRLWRCDLGSNFNESTIPRIPRGR